MDINAGRVNEGVLIWLRIDWRTLTFTMKTGWANGGDFTDFVSSYQ
jgi:hypothetical protein